MTMFLHLPKSDVTRNVLLRGNTTTNSPLVFITPHPPGPAREPINAPLDPFTYGIRISIEIEPSFLYIKQKICIITIANFKVKFM